MTWPFFPADVPTSIGRKKGDRWATAAQPGLRRPHRFIYRRRYEAEFADFAAGLAEIVRTIDTTRRFNALTSRCVYIPNPRKISRASRRSKLKCEIFNRASMWVPEIVRGATKAIRRGPILHKRLKLISGAQLYTQA